MEDVAKNRCDVLGFTKTDNETSGGFEYHLTTITIIIIITTTTIITNIKVIWHYVASLRTCYWGEGKSLPVPARHTSSAGAPLAAVQTACRFQTRRPHFPLPPRSGATLLISCRRHQSPMSALVVISSTDCSTNVAGDHGRPCLLGCRQPTLEQSTAQHHLCSHTPCFLQLSKDISISAFFPLLSPN